MKFAFKSIVVAAAFVAAGAANAAVVTIDGVASAGDQYTVSGAGSLTFSSLLRSALNVGTVQASAYGDAVTNITTSPTTGPATTNATQPQEPSDGARPVAALGTC